MKTFARFLLLAVLLSAGAALHAQQNVGITIGNALSTTAGVHCGFNCGVVTNNGRVVGRVGSSVDVILYGDQFLPAAVAIGIGPAFQPCPGFVIAGVHNSLQIHPANLLASASTGALTRTSRSCNASGSEPVLPGLFLPFAASGLVLTFQGLVFDNGQPAFTRAVDLVIQ